MIDTIDLYQDREKAANDTWSKDDILALIVQHGMYSPKILPEDIFGNSDKLTEEQTLKLFYYNLYAFLNKQGFRTDLLENGNGVKCLTDKGEKEFRIELEKDAINPFIVSIVLKLDHHIFARIKEGDLVEDDSIAHFSEGINKKVYAVVSTEDDLLARIFFTTAFVGRRKIEIRNALGLRSKSEINQDDYVSIDYARLQELIGQNGITTINNFISKYGERAFVKIIKELFE